MSHVIVLSGVSGNGKSTYAEKLLQETQGVKVSADHFFMKNGVYNFDPYKLGSAHADCFRRFIGYITSDCGLPPCVVVDNTNTTVEEISPYMLASAAFCYSVEIRTINCDVGDIDTLVARNIHGVSRSAIIAQGRRIYTRKLPSYWKHTYIDFQR
jgi:predicted ABC-type ATPase